ncbi:tRNA (adenosine(37)-N6)-threonylcarbamoyltransferase complex ATPase subunit type 1 TsaE [Erythrobacter litoralis]|uniref:tRNA (adenosine(37)-N6)-threonylcarbamoyltransferase complex ATPase subunit type 1 TsaE n=1 Tax=Erythrobacter litoralis TaxID=39960 RepID=UPI0024351FFA|nr:tRNA (adenosine(37)-N6)-threonylcarbamoyltransferase complex ATPase subunit type 1 TsaE [Erythrobacter litoralis]MDG6079794.1 tRNA (adenosine(37)-N6)-threonylcarbamoyltransferase complex ATPase subunit type 1 TsaE [Erythrobacter litoralis]
MTVDLPDLVTMASFGRRIAKVLQAGDVVALTGGLGAGKTTLARAIIAALGHRGEVPSPTFTILETYDDLQQPVVHADFYRLERPEETVELGLDDYRSGAALIAEWPDRAGGFSHEPGCLSIALETVGDGRRAIVEPGADWLERMP